MSGEVRGKLKEVQARPVECLVRVGTPEEKAPVTEKGEAGRGLGFRRLSAVF